MYLNELLWIVDVNVEDALTLTLDVFKSLLRLKSIQVNKNFNLNIRCI